MAGTWETQNKVLPGAYINIKTSEPLSITPGDRGVVVILQEMTVGEDENLYTVTVTEQGYPEGAVASDKKLIVEALKKAKTVLIYKLPDSHTTDSINKALAKLKTVKFDVLCYPYDTTPGTATANKTAIASWIKTMREDEGVKCQAVLANHIGDYEGVINVAQGVVMADGSKLAAAEATAWVAGATAGASMTTSNTGMKYTGAIDVEPRMTKTEKETAVKAGKLIFDVDSAQNVTVVYDINSLTTFTPEKSKDLSKNRVIRTLDNIANDIASIFKSNYMGKINNNTDGRLLFKSALVDYFAGLQNMSAIDNFNPDDITVAPGDDIDAMLVDVYVEPVDSAEKLYMTVNLQ